MTSEKLIGPTENQNKERDGEMSEVLVVRANGGNDEQSNVRRRTEKKHEEDTDQEAVWKFVEKFVSVHDMEKTTLTDLYDEAKSRFEERVDHLCPSIEQLVLKYLDAVHDVTCFVKRLLEGKPKVYIRRDSVMEKVSRNFGF